MFLIAQCACSHTGGEGCLYSCAGGCGSAGLGASWTPACVLGPAPREDIMEPTQETAVRREFTQQPRIPRKGLVGLRKHACSCFTFLGKTGEILAPTEDTFPFLGETNLDSILKSRDYFANKGQSSQSCGFSRSHVWM